MTSTTHALGPSFLDPQHLSVIPVGVELIRARRRARASQEPQPAVR